jgi:hypothetical protein
MPGKENILVTSGKVVAPFPYTARPASVESAAFSGIAGD